MWTADTLFHTAENAIFSPISLSGVDFLWAEAEAN